MALEIITADVLTPLRHGFFTRKGGASSGVFKGLNVGLGSSDQADIVAINRTRLAHGLGAEPGDVVTVHQTHSARAVTVTGPWAEAQPPEADALVTATPGVVLLILTADCAPVLFADLEAGVIGAAHAGWRGAFGGVLQATVAAMVEQGAERSRIRAVIGPTISQSAYEVGPEFLQRFTDQDPSNKRFFENGDGDRLRFDLPMFAASRLREDGIGHVEWSRHCTYSDPDRFFSFRRSFHHKEPDYGRLGSAIRL